jgi:hypothetical protein
MPTQLSSSKTEIHPQVSGRRLPMDGEIEAVGSRFTHEDYLMPCLLGYGDAVEIHWQCSNSSAAVAFVLISTHTKTLIKFCELGVALL